METIARRLTERFLQHGWAEPSQQEWLHYAFIRLLIQWLSCFFLLTVGILLAGVPQALLFTFGLMWLRSVAGGYHASTPLGCLAVSLVSSALCYRFTDWLPPYIILPLLLYSGAILFWLAPTNNANLHLDQKEILTLRRHSRLRWCVLCLIVLVLFPILPVWANSLALASIDTAIFLVISHLGFGQH